MSGPSSSAGASPADRRHRIRADEQGADARHEREGVDGLGALAEAIGRTGEAAGPEGVFVKPLNCREIGRRLWAEREREVCHRRRGAESLVDERGRGASA